MWKKMQLNVLSEFWKNFKKQGDEEVLKGVPDGFSKFYNFLEAIAIKVFKTSHFSKIYYNQYHVVWKSIHFK